MHACWTIANWTTKTTAIVEAGRLGLLADI